MAGRVIGGRYRLDHRVGRGGMATVWRGLDLHARQPVAVKVLDPERAAQPAALARLRREAQTVAWLDHPNIVAGHDFDIDGDVAFLAMEFVDGRSLAEMLTTEGRLPVHQAVSIAEQACAALAAAHAAGVIHRDIKPGNLIISRTGDVKVCDFGIARLQARDGSAGLTAHSMVVGTCEFMAPEQATGEPVDARSDLYALGCVLYAMLAGRPPFLGDNPMAVLHQHLHEPAVPVRALRQDVSHDLDGIVGDLLAKDPVDRPASAAEVRDRLAAILAEPDQPTAAYVRTEALPSRVGRHRDQAAWPPSRPAMAAWLREWWVSLTSAALILVTILAVAGLLASRDASRTPTVVAAGPVDTPATETQPSDPAAASTTPGPTASVTPSPAPSRTVRINPIDMLAAYAGAVQQQVDNGNLDREGGQRLLEQLAEAARRLEKGQTTKAVQKLREVDGRLDELRRDGKLTADGFRALNIVAPIIAAIPR